MNNIQLIATDLDGTFLKDDRTVSKNNIDALNLLGKKGIVRVVATGRNLRKVKEVLAPEIPFDYIVYSSGAGVYNWKEKKQLYSRNIDQKAAVQLSKYFIEKKYNFYAFRPVPENHYLWFYKGEKECEEFNRYITFHNSYKKPLPDNGLLNEGLCQFLIMIPEDEVSFNKLRTEIELHCSDIRVIRTSSPVTKGYIWVEIFHRSVSKGHGVKQICDLLGIDPQNTIGLGNDYNDLDLLEFTGQSFITENATNGIRNMFPMAPSNENDGFAKLVQPIIS